MGKTQNLAHVGKEAAPSSGKGALPSTRSEIVLNLYPDEMRVPYKLARALGSVILVTCLSAVEEQGFLSPPCGVSIWDRA